MAVELGPDSYEVEVEDQPGFSVVEEGGAMVALDTRLTPELEREGLARELVHRLQGVRRAAGLTISDWVTITLDTSDMRPLAAVVAQARRTRCRGDDCPPPHGRETSRPRTTLPSYPSAATVRGSLSCVLTDTPLVPCCLRLRCPLRQDVVLLLRYGSCRLRYRLLAGKGRG